MPRDADATAPAHHRIFKKTSPIAKKGMVRKMAKVYKEGGNPSKTIGIIAGVAAALIALIILISLCFTSVPTGHTGIITTFGKVENETLEAGLHFKLPWQKVIKMDNRNIKSTLNLSCFSSDIQEVTIVYSINYQIEKANAQTIYKSIGVDYYETVMMPRIQSSVKKFTALYTAEDLIEKREELSSSIYSDLVADLANYHIEVISTSVENIDFTDAFTAAVEAKQVAAQNKLQKQIEQDTATIQAEAAAERAIIAANAEAKTQEIQAEAEAKVVRIQADSAEYQGQKDAAINNAIAGSLTPELIRYYYILHWNGKLPETYVSSDDFLSLLDIQVQAGATDSEPESETAAEAE